MNDLLNLVFLNAAVFLGPMLAGFAALFMPEDRLKKITVFGAGLLIGTALAVIIPEGIRALAIEKPHNHTAEEDEHSDPFSPIGISLVLGFIFMLLIDQIFQNRNENVNGPDRINTATIGLVVHAAADGIALGAAATTSQTDVEIIVFLAIMLHKAPAAFGLVTYLMHSGVERTKIRKHLLIFSLAAPVLTLITYFGIGQESKDTLNHFNATGIAMLFSAGTFLYVATVHVLSELTQNNHDHSSYSKLPTLENSRPSSVLRPIDLVILVLGSLTPLLLTLGRQKRRLLKLAAEN
ncbi:zinc transporter ZIP9-B isoform X2 [Harmonia axyridis]|uniref:zinc transporter ZIP9-B isoform X2 n=1 Tax=Harmonia axyridis TaxID=115357 RepID=UPI001E276A4E|nr:zinc transporter ZIP9-B isoform X2 [Harmonia axyridis]